MTDKNINKYIVVIAIFCICTSCDILRNSPFEVLEWGPGSGYHAYPEALSVYTFFSHDPDRESAEKHFSFTGDGENVRGVFQWVGKKMVFLPALPLEINKDYCIRISPNAHDKKWLSMDREFEGRFTTRADTDRPRVVFFNPGVEGIMDQGRGTLDIRFSYPVSLNSLRGNASFSPSMSGAWHLEEDGTLAIFTPSEPWPQGKRFEFRLPASLEGSNGMAAGKEFVNIFYIGDRILPYLTGAWRLMSNGDREELICEPLNEIVENAAANAVENSGWEKDDRLLLQFSCQVDLLSVGTALTVEGASPLILEMPAVSLQAGFDAAAVFRFDKPPAYESRFSLRLRKGVKDIPGNESGEEYFFRIFANGKYSKPPSLVGIRIPMSPDDPDLQLHAYSVDQLFDDLPIQGANYPYNTKTATWIECYFDCALDAVIDPFSIMDNFRVETSNNVILFSPLVVRTFGFTAADPHPAWAGYQRLEIAGNLTNTVNAGLVHFFFNRGITDSAGNSSENQFRISLIK